MQPEPCDSGGGFVVNCEVGRSSQNFIHFNSHDSIFQFVVENTELREETVVPNNRSFEW